MKLKDDKRCLIIKGKEGKDYPNFNVRCGQSQWQCSRFQLSAWASFWVMMVRVLGHGLGLSLRGHSIPSVT